MIQTLNLRSLFSTSAVIARVKNFVSDMPSCAASTRARWCSATLAWKWNGLVACFMFEDCLGLIADMNQIPSKKPYNNKFLIHFIDLITTNG